MRPHVFDAIVYFNVGRLVFEVKNLHHVTERFCSIFGVAVFALLVLPLLLFFNILLTNFTRRVLFGATRLGAILTNIIDDLFRSTLVDEFQQTIIVEFVSFQIDI